MKINELIHLYRKQLKLTQVEFGNLVGMSHDTISLWEKGVVVPSYDALRKMCIIFDISGDEILDLETESERKLLQDAIDNKKDK